MKRFITIMALVLPVAVFAAPKEYHYKDITSQNARAFPPRSERQAVETKALLEVARRNVEHDKKNIQKEEERLIEDKAQVRRLEERLEDIKK